MRSGFHELRHVDVADARLDEIRKVHRRTGDLVAHKVKRQRLVLSFAQHLHCDVRALGAFQDVRDRKGIHAVCVLGVDEQDGIARADTGLGRRRSIKGVDDDHALHTILAHLRLDLHAHAVVAAMLVLAHLRVRLWIVEVRVRVQDVQHVRNRAVVNDLVDLFAVELVRVVAFHHGVHVSELVQAVPHGGFIRRGLGIDAPVEQRSCYRAGTKEQGE